MQINDDPLIEVIARAESEFYREPLNSFASLHAALAAAVRSFMASEEAVDRVATAIVMKADGCDWANMTERARDCEREVARAALSAAIGEEVGVGESEGGEPTGNSLS